MAPSEPVKVSVLTLTNQGGSPRRLSVFSYTEWVLGPPQADQQRHVMTELDGQSGALLARNLYGGDFSGRVAFVHASESLASATADRSSFIGRNGSLSHPAALSRELLSNRFGAGLDPCGALQVTVTLGPGETRRVVFLLGQTADVDAMRDLVRRMGRIEAPTRRSSGSAADWDETSRRRPGSNPRRFVRRDDEPVAAVPDIELPALGPVRVLPAWRRLRVSRSDPGLAWR